jgi:hypothetical protein
MATAVPTLPRHLLVTWHRADVAAYCGRDYEDYDWGVPDLLLRYNGPTCDAMHEDGPVCTRPAAHTLRHAASNGDWIVAVWAS